MQLFPEKVSEFKSILCLESSSATQTRGDDWLHCAGLAQVSRWGGGIKGDRQAAGPWNQQGLQVGKIAGPWTQQGLQVGKIAGPWTPLRLQVGKTACHWAQQGLQVGKISSWSLDPTKTTGG